MSASLTGVKRTRDDDVIDLTTTEDEEHDNKRLRVKEEEEKEEGGENCNCTGDYGTCEQCNRSICEECRDGKINEPVISMMEDGVNVCICMECHDRSLDIVRRGLPDKPTVEQVRAFVKAAQLVAIPSY
jgi:hypothetical protein